MTATQDVRGAAVLGKSVASKRQPIFSGIIARVIGKASARKSNRTSIAAVVCAYNEAERIGKVLRTLTSYTRFKEVIVVDDGSTDQTFWVASSFPVRLIRCEANRGKGSAMTAAVQATDADVILFCDADISGLTHHTIDELLESVLAGDKDMSIAQRTNSLYAIPFVLAFTPKLGGVRAVARELWDAVPSKFKRRFMIEAALNHVAQRYGRGFEYQLAEGLSQTTKEIKYGWKKGFSARIKMIGDVAAAYMQLHLAEG